MTKVAFMRNWEFVCGSCNVVGINIIHTEGTEKSKLMNIFWERAITNKEIKRSNKLARDYLNILYTYYKYIIEIPYIQELSSCFLGLNSGLYTAHIEAVSEPKECPTGTWDRLVHLPDLRSESNRPNLLEATGRVRVYKHQFVIRNHSPYLPLYLLRYSTGLEIILK